MLSPARRRQCVDHLQAELGISERRACAVAGQHRSTQRKRPRGRDDEEALTAAIIRLASQYGRYGYRRITALLRTEGWHVNAKRVQRIWRREGLKVPQKQPKRGRLWLNDGSCIRLRPCWPNHVWSYDFVQPLASQVGVAPACRALGVPRASFYRRQRPAPGHQQPRPTPARALCASERAHVLDVLASPRFVDRSPAEVVATLLDEGQYLCAERTMYRILAANQPVRERRNQRSHPCYTKPELVATGPNQTWSWDITRLRGPKRWTSFYLYVLLDIFSRCVVGWMVADRENAALAATLIEETCLKQGIEPQVLTLHSDRGAPMTSKCTAQLLADLGVTRSLSRPQVSDDNPFSEAQFKTLKYHPGFPGRFEDITAAIAFCRSFFPWYNTEHRHAGIAMLTPDDVHHHRAPDVLAQRGRTLQAAWALHPERFVHGTPKPAPLPEAVWINPPATSTTGETSQ